MPEHEQERVVRRIVESALQVHDGEKVSDQEDRTQEAVDQVRPNHGFRYSDSSISDLFRHVRRGVRADAGVDGADLTDHEG